MAALLVVGATAALGSPRGNNGTVKVSGQSVADDDPSNDSHVGCLFEIGFFGYDQGAGPNDLTASAIFTLQPGGGELVRFEDIDIGADPAGGANDLDAFQVVDLSTFVAGLPEQPEQGFHVKLTVHAEGSQGADTKHKVFWVSGCGGDGEGGGE